MTTSLSGFYDLGCPVRGGPGARRNDIGDRAGEPTAAQEVYEMTIVRRPSPLGEFMTLRQAMDRFFDDDVASKA